jgi:hypothetical protein
MSASDIIAIIAVLIALIVPGIQAFYGRRHEWHEACGFLCNEISTLFGDIDSLVLSPSKVNHITFQYHIKRRMITLKLYRKRFFLQKSRIAKVEKIMINELMELPKQIDYERLLLLGNKNYPYQYKHFCEDVRDSILDASEILIK